MLEIFARHGLPKTILTDQGTVFMSRLTQQLCQTLDVKRVRTSPYHPQSDGALERWHASLKGIMRRAEIDIKTSDKQLKYLLLFAYHTVSLGFPPFTLLFGKGPLELLRSLGTDEDSSISEWLLSVRAKMTEMAEIVSDRELKAKQTMKHFYDKSASIKTFLAGEMVLVRKPGLHCKLGDSWDGPYQVERQVSPVTYYIQVPGKPDKSKLLHCNLLRKWTTRYIEYPLSQKRRVLVSHLLA